MFAFCSVGAYDTNRKHSNTVTTLFYVDGLYICKHAEIKHLASPKPGGNVKANVQSSG